MKEFSTISDLKVYLDLHQVSKVYIQIIENVYGYYQLKEGVDSDKEPFQGKGWKELEGSPTDIGEYKSNKPIYQGYYNITNQHEVNLEWFIEKIDGFFESEMIEEDEEFSSFHHQFIDYGREEGEFDVNSEMGLHGYGLNYSELRKTMKIVLSTNGEKDNIETGLICESHGEEYKWSFDLI